MILGNILILFLPESGWSILIILVLFYLFFGRAAARNLGKTIGGFRATTKSKDPPSQALPRRVGTLDSDFETLDLKPGTSFDQVKSAYRELVKVWHPDRFGNDTKLKERANAKLMEINAAYERLKEHFEK